MGGREEAEEQEVLNCSLDKNNILQASKGSLIAVERVERARRLEFWVCSLFELICHNWATQHTASLPWDSVGSTIKPEVILHGLL